MSDTRPAPSGATRTCPSCQRHRERRHFPSHHKTGKCLDCRAYAVRPTTIRCACGRAAMYHRKVCNICRSAEQRARYARQKAAS